MEPLLWAGGAVLVGVVGVCVYVVLRQKQAEAWILEARENAPAKQIANMEAFVGKLKKEFLTTLEQLDEKHDRWLREQASLRSYIHRRLGAMPTTASASSADDEDAPTRITAEEAAQLEARAGGAVPAADASQPQSRGLTTREEIKRAWHNARGIQS
jgi:hypothetical protein